METHTCKSCGTSFTGNYCNHCGEKVIRQEDRKLKHFLGDFINAITFADNKLLRTVKTMLIAPGKLSADFVEGKRKKYMKPISIFFLANLFYFLFPLVNTFTTNLNIQVGDSFIHSKLAESWVSNEISTRDIPFTEYEFLYDTKTAELSKLLIILMALLMAGFFSIIHLGSRRNLLADHLTIGLELMAFILIYSLQVVSFILMLLVLISPDLQYLFSNFYLTAISMSMLLYYFLKMERNFYGFSWSRSIVNTLLCTLALYVSLELYRGLLFFITFWSL